MKERDVGDLVKNATDILQRKHKIFLFKTTSFLGTGYQVQRQQWLIKPTVHWENQTNTKVFLDASVHLG